MVSESTHALLAYAGRPTPDEYGPPYRAYLDYVPERGNLLALLETQRQSLAELIVTLNDTQALMVHPPYTWSIKQVLGHINDAERIFGYRALRFARGDATPLSPFNENAYAQTAENNAVPLATLLGEFDAMRQSHILMFESFPSSAQVRRGVAAGHAVSVRALGFILFGHAEHHLRIMRGRLGRG